MIHTDQTSNVLNFVTVCDHLRQLSYLVQPKSHNDIYDLYYEYEPEVVKFLDILHKKVKVYSYYEQLKELFSFKVHPGIEPEKIHLLSLIIGITKPKNKFAWRTTEQLSPNLGELNEIFKGILSFENGGPYIQVTREWQQNLTPTYWYIGN